MRTKITLRTIALGVLIMVTSISVFAGDEIVFEVGEREIIATRPQLEKLGLNWFVDGNLGVIKDNEKFIMYGANGARPVRVTGTFDNHFEAVEDVTIKSDDSTFKYLSGGPIYRDPESHRILIFYHAEV